MPDTTITERLRDLLPGRYGDVASDAIAMIHSQAVAIEMAYGLLWRITIDMQSRPGWLTYQARQALLELLDRDGQARGIEAARLLEESRNNPRLAVVAESRKNPRTAASGSVNYLTKQNDPYRD